MSKDGGKKARKYGRNADYCKTYALAGVENKNRKRSIRRHLRRNPGDIQAVNRYEQTFGRASDLGLSSHGRKLRKRYDKIASMRKIPSGETVEGQCSGDIQEERHSLPS